MNIWALWTIGGLVEVWYTGRPTVFSNIIALILFFKEVEIEVHLVESLLFWYIGFGILFAFYGMVKYAKKEVSGKTYNDIAKVLYGSIPCGSIMLLVYFLPDILSFL